jgi:uncharacterized membrane protein YphA (DoxX/SURF4 family)
LRIAVGASIIVDCVFSILAGHNPLSSQSLLACVAILSGLLLLAGYLTPLAGILVALTSIGRMSSWFVFAGGNLFDSRTAIVLEITIAISLVFLGPGAFSLDARLYGRREIIIPRSPLPPTD